MNEGRTKLTRLEILIMSSMNNSRAMNSSEGSGQTEKLCEMHCRWMTKADVEINQKTRPEDRENEWKAKKQERAINAKEKKHKKASREA